MVSAVQRLKFEQFGGGDGGAGLCRLERLRPRYGANFVFWGYTKTQMELTNNRGSFSGGSVSETIWGFRVEVEDKYRILLRFSSSKLENGDYLKFNCLLKFITPYFEA